MKSVLSRKIYMLSISLLVVHLTLSCTKKRKEEFVQGQGINLLKISDFQDKEYALETEDEIAEVKTNLLTSETDSSAKLTLEKTNQKQQAFQISKKSDQSNAQSVQSNQSQTPIKVKRLVKYKTNSDLMQDVPVVALPHNKSDYKIKYKMQNRSLIVMKVAKKEFFHQNEVPSLIELKDKQFALPLVSYPVTSLINIENMLQNGQKSNQLIERSVNTLSEAQYFKIDKQGRTLLQLKDKLDLLPKSYFTGKDNKSEWYFARTIVATSDFKKEYLGYLLGEKDNQLNSLTKVKFILDKNYLKGINVNLDERINLNEELNQMPLLTMPIEWKSYRIKKTGLNNELQAEEEENNEIPWDAREYIRLQALVDTQKIVDLEIEENYLSITYLEEQYNVRIKLSFLRDVNRQSYKAKRYFKTDHQNFGFFTTQKHEINNYEKYKESEYGKNIFINRYNPALPEIKFYFTEGSDEKLIPYAAKAADEWSKAFEAAGLKIKVVADTSKRVKLGDIRYNQINLIKSVNESNLFGYGPSVTDPRTGEIISATTNMHMTSIVSSLVGHIREYINFKSGKTSKFSVLTDVLGQLQQTIQSTTEGIGVQQKNYIFLDEQQSRFNLTHQLPFLDKKGDLSFAEIKSINSLVNNPAFKNKQNIQVSKKAITIMPSSSGHNSLDRISENNLNSNYYGREFDIAVTGKHLNEEIETECKEIKDLIEKNSQQNTTNSVISDKANSNEESTKSENQIIIACAEKLVPYKMMGTLLHEMGHNFGLRHNFYGSVDIKNFLPKEVTKTNETVNSSSVMEYTSFGEDRLTKIGLYDIAALRFGYAEQVETKTGDLVKINENQSLHDLIQTKSIELKPYLFCTDEDVEVGEDPLCARHDAGVTADQVAFHLINEYNATIETYNNRLDRYRKIDPRRLTSYRVNQYWIPLKKIYDEWRFKLSDQLGIGSEYLDSVDQIKLTELYEENLKNCDRSQNPRSQACLFVDYKKASEIIFNFSLNIATLPPKSCFGTRNNKIVSVEFADIRRIIMSVHKFVPENCLNAEVKKYVEQNYNFSPVLESGYELEDVRTNMKVEMSEQRDWFGNPIPTPPDIIGLMPEKAIAIAVLTSRSPLSYSSEEKTFRPNLLDEPLYREQILKYIIERLTQGVPVSRYLSAAQIEKLKKDLPQVEINTYLEKFKNERKYINELVYSIMYGLDVPDKKQVSFDRRAMFMVKYSDRQEVLNKAIYKVASDDGTNYYAIMKKDAVEAKKLIDLIESLPKRMQAASPLNNLTFVKLYEQAKNILPSQKSPAESQRVDADQFLNFMYSVLEDEFQNDMMTKSRTKEQFETDKYRPHWKAVLKEEVSVTREFFATEFKQDNSNDTSVDKALPTLISNLDTIKNPKSSSYIKVDNENYLTSYNKISKFLYDEKYNLTFESLDQRIQKYRSELEQSGKVSGNDDVYNFEELTVQLELIMSVMRSYMTY